MFESLDRLAAELMSASVDDLHDVDRAALNDALIQLRTVIRRLEALELSLTKVHDHRQAWKVDGANSAKQWHRDRCGMTAGEASRHVRSAWDLDKLPRTAEMVSTGEISVDQARVAAAATRGLPDDSLRALDELVSDTAPRADLTQVRDVVTRFSHRVEPDSVRTREQLAHDRRGIRLNACADGGVWIEGRLDTLAGEAALTVVSTLSAPRGTDDDRTSEQRTADALGDVFVRALSWHDALPVDGGRLPAVSVVADWATLRNEDGAPAAELDNQGPVSGETARQLACDANIHRVVTRGNSAILDLGRASRVVSIAQRRALVARDRGCVGCTAPPAWTDAHHVVFWADGGPTDLDNLVLLCRSCHTGVHHRRWRVVRGADDSWAVERPPRRPHDPADAPSRGSPNSTATAGADDAGARTRSDHVVPTHGTHARYAQPPRCEHRAGRLDVLGEE